MGSKPSKQIEPDIRTSTVIRVLRRPILSASGPKKQAAQRPNEEVQRERGKAAEQTGDGVIRHEKSLADVHRQKTIHVVSYHSMRCPDVAPINARRRCRMGLCC